jgi:alpha-D-ribose 1-methylphosphonate 5-triphosphate synthase subunit PhnH
MAIDLVHDTQEVFRTILHCMSRPGTIKSIVEVSERLGRKEFCHNSTFLSAMTLLDAEVRFHVVGENAVSIEKLFSAYTMSKVTNLQEADYIFITLGAEKQFIHDVFTNAKKGTLVNPQQSATVIIETEMLSNEHQLTLEGPGIATTESVGITASEYWLTVRAEANKEYPLGVDMILIDRNSNIMCLPRTTIIHDCEVF